MPRSSSRAAPRDPPSLRFDGAPTGVALASRICDDRHRAAIEWKRRTGGQVVGCVGDLVPPELVMAAGMLPVRVTGEPGGPVEAAAHHVERGADPATLSIAARLLDGTYGYVDHLVIASTPQILASLYQFLLDPQIWDQLRACPSLHLFDFHPVQGTAVAAHNLGSLALLRSRLGDWSGSPIRDEAIVRAMSTCDGNRKLAADVAALRHGSSPRLRGRDALALLAARLWMPIEDHNAMLADALADAADRPPLPGLPVIYSGCNTDDLRIYAAIEKAGVVIIGDDQDYGSRGCASPGYAPSAPLEALRAFHQDRAHGPAGTRLARRRADVGELARTSGARAAVFHLLASDHAAAWELPRLRAALAEQSLDALDLGPQPYAGASHEQLTRSVAKLLAGPAPR